MKTLKAALLITGFLLMISACNCDSKQSSWSVDQQNEWKSNCMKFMTDRGVEDRDATDFCDCMYSKTSNKYTPEEAKNITTEEERKMWNECDYSW